MTNEVKIWRVNAQEILKSKPWSLKFIKTIQAVAQFIQANQWQGACHAISAILYVLLSEQGIKSKLCIGEVLMDKIAFNHSWIEIDGDVYDVAIINTLDDRFRIPPTIKGFDIETKTPTKLVYGSSTGLADDEPTLLLKQMRFDTFMDSFPYHRDGLWGFVTIIGNKLGLRLDIETLKTQYSQSKWHLK